MEVALARLRRRLKLPGPPRLSKPMKLPDGRVLEANTPFPQTVDALREVAARDSAHALPDMRLPPNPRGRQPAFVTPTPDSIVPGLAALPAPLREFARFDRLVGYTTQNQLVVFNVGNAQPVFSSAVLSAEPDGIAWTGPNLLVWNAHEIALLAQDGKIIWHVEISSLPAAEVVQAPAEETSIEDDNAAEGVDAGPDLIINGQRIPRDVLLNNGQRIQIRGGQVQVVRNARLINGRLQIAIAQQQQQQPQQPADQPVAGAAEQIVHVRPLTDRIIFATSSGRVG